MRPTSHVLPMRLSETEDRPPPLEHSLLATTTRDANSQDSCPVFRSLTPKVSMRACASSHGDLVRWVHLCTSAFFRGPFFASHLSPHTHTHPTQNARASSHTASALFSTARTHKHTNTLYFCPVRGRPLSPMCNTQTAGVGVTFPTLPVSSSACVVFLRPVRVVSLLVSDLIHSKTADRF